MNHMTQRQYDAKAAALHQAIAESNANSAELLAQANELIPPPNRYRPPSKDVRRLTVRVPLVETTVDQWWRLQHDASASVITLIREEIAERGFIDSAHRPIAQVVQNDTEAQAATIALLEQALETLRQS